MILSLSIGGITFGGADVGGFFKDPDTELLVRWYEVGAFHPFFRAHAHIDTKRREPWLFGEPVTSHIRACVRRRYAILPYLYTVFHTAAVYGTPVMRPLWMEFPEEERAFAEEQQFMLGGRWCECSSDVHFCSLHSAHANLKVNMQLRFYSRAHGGARHRRRRHAQGRLSARFSAHAVVRPPHARARDA
jgi:hypothetical protein